MTPDKDAEIARLRRELEVALEAARVNGEERDEMAKALGAEVATTQRLKAALQEVRALWGLPNTNAACHIIDAALASGNGDGGGK